MCEYTTVLCDERFPRNDGDDVVNRLLQACEGVRRMRLRPGRVA